MTRKNDSIPSHVHYSAYPPAPAVDRSWRARIILGVGAGFVATHVVLLVALSAL